jgi:hypothetical protein
MLEITLNRPPIFAALFLGLAVFALTPTPASAQTPQTRCILLPGVALPGVSVQAGFNYRIDHSGKNDKCQVKNTQVTLDPICPVTYHLQRRKGRDRCSH